MFDKILRITGTLALYGGASMFFAILLLSGYLKYAWNIDNTKWMQMLAIAQGLDISDIKKAVEERVAKMSYDDVLQIRAKKLRENEFSGLSLDENVTQKLLADEKKIDAKLKQIDLREKAFKKTMQDALDKSKAAGLAEETRLIENADPEFAKDIILGIIKDSGDTNRVLTMLLSMDEAKRGGILYEMTKQDELKELCNLLQRIGNGEPLSTVIADAQKTDQAGQNTPIPNSTNSPSRTP
ncbi:MAG: hypothetical protein ACRCUY_03435 [Thermoguttaceae bacterium]